MCKEKLITAYEIPEYVEGDPYLRIPCTVDKNVSTMKRDKETGEFITLWEEKIRYPYKTRVASKLVVRTTERELTFILRLDDGGSYVWNGQNIPRIFWTILGISKDSSQGWVASKWHDNILDNRWYFLKEIKEIDPYYEIQDFRRLTSLIFRRLLINYGVGEVKASIMSWFVDLWQSKSSLWRERRKKVRN